MIELPPGPTAGGVSDFWQREIGVLGEMGPEPGAGGKYLVVPPGTDGAGRHPTTGCIESTAVNVMFGFRTLDPDPERSQALVDAVRIYPYGAGTTVPRPA